MITYEDLPPGTILEMGPKTVTKDDIVRFAKRYDPMPFHLDETAARESIFGEICASGWHVAGMCMRMIVDGFLSKADSRGGAGIDELRWLKPVFPGDELRVKCTVLGARISQSRPDMGLINFSWELFDQNDTLKMKMRSTGLVGLRGKAPAQ